MTEALAEKAVKELKHGKTCVAKINVFPLAPAEESLTCSNKGTREKVFSKVFFLKLRSPDPINSAPFSWETSLKSSIIGNANFLFLYLIIYCLAAVLPGVAERNVDFYHREWCFPKAKLLTLTSPLNCSLKKQHGDQNEAFSFSFPLWACDNEKSFFFLFSERFWPIL